MTGRFWLVFHQQAGIYVFWEIVPFKDNNLSESTMSMWILYIHSNKFALIELALYPSLI